MQTLTLADVPSSDDGIFLERVHAGDLDAIGEVYDRHHRALYAFASRLLGDDAAAEDLVHDVFVALPKLVHKYNPDKSLKAFLLAVAANRARHYVRSAARRRAMAERLGREPEMEAPTPEHCAERSRLARVLACSLDRLSFDLRLTFVLCEIDGHSSRQASEILGIPEATVRTRIFHARQKLRSFLVKEDLP